MKKRMFLTTVLMTLVLLLAVTTATFAWYQASNTQAFTTESTTGSLETSGTSGQVGNLEFVFAFAGTGAEYAIQDVELTDKDGITWVYNAQGVLVEANNQQALKKTEAVTVTLSDIKDNGVSVEEANWSQFVGTYTITLKAGQKVKLAASAAAAEKAALEAEVTFTVIIAADGKVSYANNTVYYGMDGTGSTKNQNVSGTINATKVVLNKSN